MLTLGIDLSSQRTQTAACLLSWRDGHAQILELSQRLDNSELVTIMRRAECVAVDAPFGWPVGFLDALTQWRETDRWPLPWPDAEAMDRLRLRETDRWVRHQLGKHPLSVSSSGIAVTAWRAAALLSAYYADHELPLDRIYGPVREVYPGAALLGWELIQAQAAESYKRSRPAREQLLERMAPAGRWLQLSADQREQLADSDHQLDALVGALVARAAAVGLTHLPPPELDTAVVAQEGWIAHPLHASWSDLSSAEPDR